MFEETKVTATAAEDVSKLLVKYNGERKVLAREFTMAICSLGVLEKVPHDKFVEGISEFYRAMQLASFNTMKGEGNV